MPDVRDATLDLLVEAQLYCNWVAINNSPNARLWEEIGLLFEHVAIRYSGFIVNGDQPRTFEELARIAMTSKARKN